MLFNLGTTSAQDTARYVCAYLDEVTGFTQALETQVAEPGVHERHTSLTLFHARSVPTIDLETYTLRILKYCPFQNEVLLGLIVYLQQMVDRCAQRRVPFTVDAYSIHRLIITGVTIGSKWFSDVFFTNSRYAKVGGLSVAELNNLELQFLSIIDFDLNIQPEVLQAVGSDLFFDRLPKLTNAPYPLDPVYAYPPTSAAAAAAFTTPTYPSSRQYPLHNGAHYTHNNQQIPGFFQNRNYSYQQQSQRAHKSMSYPGPSGVYYNNNPPHDIMYNSNTGGIVPDAYCYKQAYPKQNDENYHVQDPSSGSTLVSSPPRGAVA
ncbi:cyclin-like protein interacting with PHO85 [Coemansia sp. RSA 1285]|nr:cyclin-like protein interacting with PHO85 [Coemansia sp. RSA 1285]